MSTMVKSDLDSILGGRIADDFETARDKLVSELLNKRMGDKGKVTITLSYMASRDNDNQIEPFINVQGKVQMTSPGTLAGGTEMFRNGDMLTEKTSLSAREPGLFDYKLSMASEADADVPDGKQNANTEAEEGNGKSSNE